jgi:hypothetical protein
VAVVPAGPFAKVWPLSVSTPLVSTLFSVLVVRTTSTAGGGVVVVEWIDVVVSEDID